MSQLSSLLLVLTISFLRLGKTDEQCKTPNNEDATCISLYACPHLLKALTNPSTRSFVLQSNCGGTALEPKVCCGPSSNFTTPRNEEVNKKNVLLPDKRVCGIQHSDDFFHTVNNTIITEFPWLALIAYKRVDELPVPHKYLCSGSLLNKRYILTAAQCLTQPKFVPIEVRLGEYHTNNETDCMLDSFLTECSETVEDFGIEKAIPHPDFKFGNPQDPYDIGLIRLNRLTDYSDYIRPICLPLPGTERPKVGEILLTSGWGKSKNEDFAVEKKKTYSTFLSPEECKERYQKGGIALSLAETQFCGLLTPDSDLVCKGDAGGPVMYSHKMQWYQEGIVSFGTTQCLTEYPEVYTNVAYYVEWILENLEL